MASSLDAADSLLRELGQLDAQEQRLKAECDEACAQAKTYFAERLIVDVDGVDVPIADRRKAILKGLEAFADSNRDELLDGDAKSRELNHGVLGWRKSKPALVPATKKGTAAGNKERLETVLAFIADRIEKLRFFAAGTARFLRIRCEWDKSALLTAIQKSEIDRDELRQAGYLLDEGADEFFAEPKSQDLTSQPGG